MKTKIIFDCLGFSSATVFVEKDNRQYQIGYITSKFYNDYEFSYGGIYERHLTKEEIPTVEQVLNEYKKQFIEKGVIINNEIVYAG